MPDAAPARLPPEQVLDESLAALYRRLEAEPAPEALLRLVERLETAYRGATVGAEPRAIG
jgi:hypothetical protein